MDLDDGYPFSGYPRGWFQVAWADEIAPGAVHPMRYFGRDLVAYRSDSGELHVMDAHCPHLGAHLGYGGRVEGDCIRCPYHGWKYDASGRNVEIPLSPRVNRAVSIPTWVVHEDHELVFVWFDPDGGEPAWDPPQIPELSDTGRYAAYPALAHIWPEVATRPQFIIENTVDVRHQQWVHRSPSVHELTDWEVRGPYCRSRQRATFGLGREKTWLTPNGPVEAYLDVEAFGIGVNAARFIGTDDSVHIGCHTPVDEHHLDERLTVIARIEPGHEDGPSAVALKRFAFQVAEVTRDIVIWEHMRYVERPPFTADESRVWRELRAWTAGFYELNRAGRAM